MLSGVLQFTAARSGQIVWRRWKAGLTLHEIGAPLAKSIPPFVVWWRVTITSCPSSVSSREIGQVNQDLTEV